MATVTQDSDVAKSGQSVVQNGELTVSDDNQWDEEQLEKALDTLHELYIQCRNLRTTIPRLVAPLTTKQSSPREMFVEFSTSSKTANQEIQQFRKTMSDPETKRILDHATKSRAENPDGIKPWMITSDPDWYDGKS